MISLVNGGMTIRKACGSTMTLIAGGREALRAAASTWPFGTAWMPARIVSAM